MAKQGISSLIPAVALAAGALILVAACTVGGSGPSGGNPAGGSSTSGHSGPSASSSPTGGAAVSSPETPQQALIAAVTQSANMTSATETLAATDSGAVTGATTGTIVFERTPNLVVAEDLTISANGKSTEIKVIITDTAVYLSEASLASQIGKPWIKLDLSALKAAGLANLAQLVQSLQSNNFFKVTQLFAADRNVHAVGSQTLGGVQTTEYAGSFQAAQFSAALAPAVRKVLAPVLQPMGDSTVVFHIWIDGQHQARKVTEAMTTSAGLTVNTTMTITGIDQPVQITFPPASQTFTPPGS